MTDHLRRENAALRHLVEEKTAEIKMLRKELTGTIDRYVGMFDLTPTEARILAVIDERGRVGREALTTLAWPDREYVLPKTVDVTVCKLRKKLPLNVEIGTLCGYGYEMSRESRDALRVYAAPAPTLVPTIEQMVPQ